MYSNFFSPFFFYTSATSRVQELPIHFILLHLEFLKPLNKTANNPDNDNNKEEIKIPIKFKSAFWSIVISIGSP